MSGLIFVVIALAWVGYLVPKALRHHDELQANRPVEDNSPSMRVLERTPAAAPSAFTSPAPGVEFPAVARTRTSRAAAARRRRVLVSLLFVTAVLAGLSTYGVIPAWSTGIGVVMVFAWLVACRAAVRPPVAIAPVVAAPIEEPVVVVEPVAPVEDEALWDPIPLTLPTYVTKPAARRTIRTIELESTAAPVVVPSAPVEEVAIQAEAV
jgi:hypothetical protein